jgi:molybdopterin converting factor small subunit
MVRVLFELLAEATLGATIDQLREMAPSRIKRWEGSENDLSSLSITIALSGTSTGTSTASATGLQVAIALSGSSAGTSTASGTIIVLPRVTRALQRAAWEYAADYIEKNDMPVSSIILTLQLEDGTEATIEVRQPPPGDNESI